MREGDSANGGAKDDDKDDNKYPDVEHDGGGMARESLEIVLPDGRARKIKFVNNVMFWGSDGKPVSAQEFIKEMFGSIPSFFTSSEDLHRQWADPDKREALLSKMEEAGYGRDILKDIRKIMDAEECDLLDVLEYVAYATDPIERRERAERLKDYTQGLTDVQRQFVEYLTVAYIKSGVEELGADKLPMQLTLKFGSVNEGIQAMGGVPAARNTFREFQQRLYA